MVPLPLAPPEDAEEGKAILQKYWDQVQTQVTSLELSLGRIKHVYHETLPEGGEEGLKYLAASGEQGSHALAQARCQDGAVLEATEDGDILMETMDLQRCLMLPFASEKVAGQLHEWLADATRRRNEHISRCIDESLGQDEVGLMLINERHQVQFASDMEVFYVAPPALDEYRRWVEAWMARQRAAATQPAQEAQPSDEPSDDGESPTEPA